MVDVSIGERDVEVTLRPRTRLLTCVCGYRTGATYDRRRRRWRHLDLGKHRLWLVYDIRRIDCSSCGVRTEDVPWARPGARHTRDFEDTVVWLVKRTDRTTVATLMRCAWETVTSIVHRTVAEMLDQRRLDTLYRIGVDEVCYRHPHKYLTIIGDHDTGKVVHVEPGRGSDSITNFYLQQTDSERAAVDVVSMDAAPAWRSPTETYLPNATTCIDPFHVIQWANRALDRVFADAIAQRHRGSFTSGEWRRARTALRTGENKLSAQRRRLVRKINRSDRAIGKAWRLKERLRDLYRTKRTRRGTRKHLRRWIIDARRSNIPAMVGLSRSIDKHYDGIVAAVDLGVSNALIEGINAKIRLINARGYGHHSAETLTAMIYLNLGGIDPKLPTQT